MAHPSQKDTALFSAFRILFGTLLVLVTFGTTAFGSDPFCLMLEKIIQSGENKFQFITGKMELVSEEHIGLLVPPGFTRCFGWVDGMAYHCEGPEGLSADDVGKIFDQHVQSFDDCLSDIWKKTERHVNRVSGRTITTFSTDLTRIQIALSERHKRHGWFVDVYFRR